jgi:uncharacterized phiE125 gp8 family phage protein
MQVRVKSGQSLTDPVTASEFKTFIGYPGTDQDALIASMITAAREFLESETGLSCVSKVYQVEFDRWDMISDDLTKIGYSGFDDGWYRLPYSPVKLISTVTIGGTTTSYSQRGQKIIEIHPDQLVQTGTSNNILAVEFTAGEANNTIKNAILRITSDLFNNREDYSGMSMSAIGFDTQRLISNLSTNTGF